MNPLTNAVIICLGIQRKRSSVQHVALRIRNVHLLRIQRTTTTARSSAFARGCLLNGAIVELLLVTLDPVFRRRRKNIEKLPLAGRDHFNHLRDHVFWIEPSLWFTEQTVDSLLEGFALVKVMVSL